MGKLFLGVDVGGTKTHVLLSDTSGDALALGQGGPANPETVGYKGLARLIDDTLDQALEEAGRARHEIVSGGFGIGGYDWPSQREPLLAALRSVELDFPIEIVNDALIALLAGAEQGWGVAVVAGTSCNAWGLGPDGNVGRMTGFSWLGEAAGAGELVQAALRAIAHQWTRRGPPTRLTEAFVERTNCRNVEDFLEKLTLGQLHVRAEHAPLVFQVASEGDPVAAELIRWAGRELGDLAIGVIRQLDLQTLSFEIVLGGSFFKGSPVLMETMQQTIFPVAPQARLTRLHAPPVVGGVLLGMREAGVETQSLRRRLLASTALFT